MTEQAAPAQYAFAVDWAEDPSNICPTCKSPATARYIDPKRGENWGRCFKCLTKWDVKP